MLDDSVRRSPSRRRRIGRRHVRELRKTLAGKERPQKLFTQVASALFNFGIDNDYCSLNPAAHMKRPGQAKPYLPWTDAQCADVRGVEAGALPHDRLHVRAVCRVSGAATCSGWPAQRMTVPALRCAEKTEATARNEPLLIPAHMRLKAYLDQLPKDSLCSSWTRTAAARRDRLQQSVPSCARRSWIAAPAFPWPSPYRRSALAEAGCSEPRDPGRHGSQDAADGRALHQGGAPEAPGLGGDREAGRNGNRTGKWQTRRVEWQTFADARVLISDLLHLMSER